MKQEWTPTEAEQREVVRAAAVHYWRATALPGVVLVAGMALLALGLSGPVLALVLAVLAAAWLGWAWTSSLRSAREVLGAAYPVGTTVAAEATEDALVLSTGTGTAQVAWERFTRPRVGPVFLTARDGTSRQWLMVPRRLFPDAWLERIGVPPRRA
ncbi:hypothetical protein G5V59_14185 [Nocardioides sp. W3-2-3]|uniref:hypothetical protein n=1 Tax=Nocardioides convexus TaxID=2712224 RepID=UPI0024186279|nr:hypothetical protein [Nocardioides convexus]NHA00748.1 hypothetical protein [Nocardioides convexus]